MNTPPKLRRDINTRRQRTTDNRQRTALALLLVALLLPTGCRRRAEPGTLVIAIEATPRGFDPRFSTVNTYSARLMQLIYDTLLIRNERLEFVPSLAEKFEESDDRKTFTFHLRSGVRFHNGKPLTSADVKYTFDSLLAPELKSPIRGALDRLTSIETPDPGTVVFRCREPFHTFIGSLPAVGIIPEGAGAELINAPIGSGPFKLIYFKEGEIVKLEANPDYWGGAPGIPRVEVKVVADNTTRQAELMSGAVDLAYNVGFDPETIRALSSRRGIQVVLKEGANVDYLGLNLTQSSQLASQKLRQAIALAIDREVIIHNLLRDQARRAEAMMPPEHWAYSPGLTIYDHDPERATQLMDEAGFIDPDGDGPLTRLELNLYTTTTQISRNIASILQDQLRRVGIQLNLQSLELATLLDRINKGQFDMYYLRAIGFNQSTDVFQFVYHSRYQNAEFNDAIAKLRATTDAAQMQPLFDRLAKVLRPDRALRYPDSVNVRTDYCRNFEVMRLAAQAEEMDSNADAAAKKELYLQIAKLLTDRGGQNRMRYCNPQVDEWIVEAERSNDRAAKIALYARIQKTISEELPQIYLWYPSNALVASRRVAEIEIDPSGSWYFIAKLSIKE
jgi:peptide/nickel transport system substrate-binding protein